MTNFIIPKELLKLYPGLATIEEAKVEIECFDFSDGPVKAKRHVNPDGSLGGWVAATAKVDPTVYVGENAQVSGNAKVTGNAKVSGYAVVYGYAVVTGNAVISDNTKEM